MVECSTSVYRGIQTAGACQFLFLYMMVFASRYQPVRCQRLILLDWSRSHSRCAVCGTTGHLILGDFVGRALRGGRPDRKRKDASLPCSACPTPEVRFDMRAGCVLVRWSRVEHLDETSASRDCCSLYQHALNSSCFILWQLPSRP